MTAEELNNQFGAVLSENVGEVTNNVNANALPKAAGAFLMSNNRYSHTVRIGNTGVTYPTFFVASFDGTAHHVSCNTLEDKCIYVEEAGEFRPLRHVVQGFALANWENLVIRFERTEICIVFDTQSGQYIRRRTSLFRCEEMTADERPIADAVRTAWNERHQQA